MTTIQARSAFHAAAQSKGSLDRLRPKVLRPLTGQLYVWLPYNHVGIPNRRWIQSGFGDNSKLMLEVGPNKGGVWRIARGRLNDVVQALTETSTLTDVWLQFSRTTQCDLRCQAAKGDECVCSCLGEGHGGGRYQSGRNLQPQQLVLDEEVVETYIQLHRGEGARFAGLKGNA